jgi:CDP-diacylglycerol--glycerol-3-phosphate 3-phosphatidyltransferase
MFYFIQCLTYFRIISAPLIFFLIVIHNSYGWALILFVLASSTDYWDGYLARKFNLNSIFGEVLDPIADKILITFIIISLTLELSSWFVGFVGGLMLTREFWVAALRDFNAREGRSKATVVTFLAKIKTAVQLITFSLFLLGLFLQNALLIFLANFFLFLALIITIQTGLSYTIASFRK